jgi:hypothetical protein
LIANGFEVGRALAAFGGHDDPAPNNRILPQLRHLVGIPPELAARSRG